MLRRTRAVDGCCNDNKYKLKIKKDLKNLQNKIICSPQTTLMCKQKVTVGNHELTNTPLTVSQGQFRKGEHNSEAQSSSQYLSQTGV